MPASLQRPRSAHTVLLRMAADEARAQRIRDLKASRPDLTWPRVADAIPISERSVAHWAATGAIGYDNCVKLAGVFKVDVDWLWRGAKAATPDLMAALPNGNSHQTQLDLIEAKLDALLSHFEIDEDRTKTFAAGAKTAARLRREHPDSEPTVPASEDVGS